MTDPSQAEGARPHVVEPSDGELNAEARESRFVFYAMLSFAGLTAIFSAFNFSLGQMQTASVLACVGMLVLVGVLAQILSGLRPWVRRYYGFCGLAPYIYLILRGDIEQMGLLGALVLVPGFPIVLRWRLGAAFLGPMLVFTGVVFIADWYLDPAQAFPTMAELKFIISFAGLAGLSLGVVYNFEMAFAQVVQSRRRIRELAYRDPLTDLPNRKAVEDLLDHRWDEFRRSGHKFAILICNLDNFREINEQFGRDFGDGVLVRVANVLTKGLRGQDVITRWSGDEFLIMLPGQSLLSAEKVAQRLCRRIEDIQLAMFGVPVPVTASIGVAAVEGAPNQQDMMRQLKTGLARAKSRGKNRVAMA
ncbi:MAG: GGDEF domain-containing protein [Porticoccaceae bacterium]